MTSPLPRFRQPLAVVRAIEAMHGWGPRRRGAVISYQPVSDEWQAAGLHTDVLVIDIRTKDAEDPLVIALPPQRLEPAQADISVEYALAPSYRDAEITSLAVTVTNVSGALANDVSRNELRNALIGIFGERMADSTLSFIEDLRDAHAQGARHPTMRRLQLGGTEGTCDIALVAEEFEAGQLASNNLQLMSHMFSDAPGREHAPLTL